MDISDYNNRLAKSREDYHQKGQELKKNYETNLEQIQSTNKNNEAKQAEAYNSSRREIENSSEKLIGSYNKKSQEEIDRLQKDFREQLQGTRTNFEETSGKDRADFAQRLNNIRDDYQRSNKLTEAQHQQTLTNNVDRLQGNLKKFKEETYRDNQALENKAQGQYKDYREKAMAENRELAKRKDSEINQLVQGENFERSKMNSKHQEAMEQIRKVQQNEMKHVEDHHDNQITTVRDLHEDHNKGLMENYARIIGQIEKRNEYDQDRLQRENKAVLRSREKEFQKDIHMLDKKATDIANNGGRGDSARVDLERTKKAYEERLARSKEMMQDQGVHNQEDKAKFNDQTQQMLRNQALENYKEVDRKDKENAEFTAKMTEKFRDEKQKVTEQYKGEIKRGQNETLSTLNGERRGNRIKFDNQKNDFSRRMNIMNEKNIETIAQMQQEHAQEKTAFIENAKKQIHNNREDLKEDLNATFLKTSTSYEQKISNLEHQNEKIMQMYEDKILNLQKKNHAEVEHLQKMEEDRRQDDVRMLKRTLEGKDMETAKTLVSVRNEFGKKLSESRHHNEVQTSELTRRYEEMINRLNAEHHTELTRKLSQARDHFERLAKTSEIEKESLRNKYETKIQKLEEAVDRAREVAKNRARSTPESAPAPESSDVS